MQKAKTGAVPTSDARQRKFSVLSHASTTIRGAGPRKRESSQEGKSFVNSIKACDDASNYTSAGNPSKKDKDEQ